MRSRRTIQIAGAVIIAVLAGLVAGSARAGDVNHARIAYSSLWDGQTDIYAMLDDGTAQVNLTHDATIEERADVEPVWSPDGTLVVFERQNLKGGHGTSLMVVNSEGTKLHNLLPHWLARTAYCHPAFTPDGKTIVFTSNMDGNFDLYGVKVNGQGMFRITTTEAPIQNFEPQVARDGRTVVFTRPERSMLGGSSIYTTRIGDTIGGAYQLTHNYRWAGDHDPVFSPDGNYIAFSSDRAGSNDVYVMKYNGNAVTQLTTKTSDDNHPTWSPTGASLAFVSDRTGATEIFGLSIATGQLKQLTFDKALKSNPMWQASRPTLISPPNLLPSTPNSVPMPEPRRK